MKKTIDTSKLSNDLAASSVYFRKPSPLPVPSAPPPPPSAQTPQPGLLTPEKQGNKETRKQPSPSRVQGDGQSGKATPVPFAPEPLQGKPMTRKQTFELTRAELDFMDKAKFELRALGVTKNEMVLTGLELLAKDYNANRKRSYLYRKFASREAEESQD